MGLSYRFRISEMIPNAWFYKLRDMAKSRKQRQNGTTADLQKRKQQAVLPSGSPKTARFAKLPNTPCNQPRKSYHIARELEEKRGNSGLPAKPRVHVDPPRKSTKERISRRKSAGSLAGRSWPNQVSYGGSSRRSRGWIAARSESPPYPAENSSSEGSSGMETFSPDLRSSSCSCSSNITNSKNDVVVSPELELRPIITKPPPPSSEKPKTEPIKPKANSPGNSTVAGPEKNSPRITKNKPSSPTGIKLRLNSPRLITGGRRSVSRRSISRRISTESYAVLKLSSDPIRDFKESMEEMIVANRIRDSKDLQNLLRCYLSLNAAVYHKTIIKVFRQIWFDLRVDRSIQL